MSPYITEFSKTGKIVFDARLTVSGGDESYRAYRIPWTSCMNRSAANVRRAARSACRRAAAMAKRMKTLPQEGAR